jgi:hypothetical protein
MEIAFVNPKEPYNLYVQKGNEKQLLRDFNIKILQKYNIKTVRDLKKKKKEIEKKV